MQNVCEYHHRIKTTAHVRATDDLKSASTHIYVFTSHLPARFYSLWLGTVWVLHFHHSWSACLKVSLKPMTRWSWSLQHYWRISNNKVDLLIQLQTRFISCNFFTIKAFCTKCFRRERSSCWSGLLTFNTFNMHKNSEKHRGGKIWKSTERFPRFFLLRSQEETSARPETGSLVWFPDRQINQWCTGPTAPTLITVCVFTVTFNKSVVVLVLEPAAAYETQTNRTGPEDSLRKLEEWERKPESSGVLDVFWVAGCLGYVLCTTDIIRLCRFVEILLWFAELVQVILTCSPAVDINGKIKIDFFFYSKDPMNHMWEHWRFIEELRFWLTVCCDELCSGSDRTRVTRVCQSHLSSAFTWRRRQPLIGWEGNDPSCCHSAIRTAHLHTGDLNLLQSVQKDSDIQDWSTWCQWSTMTSCSPTFNGPIDKKSRFLF